MNNIINPNPITTTPETFDGVWMKSININAPLPNGPVRVVATLCPYNISSGAIHPTLTKIHVINDVKTAATGSLNIEDALLNINAYIQTQVQNGVIKF